MAADQHHKQWGVADFERYHSGKMPEAEMHALEKAALDDPFLEDALEGYAFTKTPSADIEQIQQKLWSAPEDVKTPVVWFKRKAVTQLFKAAAILIIFGGLGWFILNRNNKDNVGNIEQVASVDKTKNDTGNIASLYNLNDTAPIVAKLDDKKVEAVIKHNNAAVNDEVIHAPGSNYDINIPAEKDDMARNNARQSEKVSIIPHVTPPAASPAAPVIIAQSKAKEEEASARKSMVTIAQQQQARGRVVDTDGNPVPFATVRNNADRRQSVAADAQGNFALTNNGQAANNNSVPVEVNAVGYQQLTTNINNATDNTIVLSESNEALNEVVVTGLGKKTKKDDYQWNGKNSRIQLKNATPLEGWPYFYYVMNDSIANNKQLNQLKGSIVLQFDTDESGVVKNIVVTKSLNDSADNAARKILSQSPVLKIKNSKNKGEAIIKLNK